MKKVLLFLVLTTWLSFGYSANVQKNEAKIIAMNWINSQGGNFFEMEDVGTVYSKIENKVPIFYIVTFKPEGWVIVSGSDIAEPVLGYSANSQFDMDKMPPQVEGWMEGISSEIRKAINTKLATSTEIRRKWKSYGGKLFEKQNLKSVQSILSGPLLSSTWNQGRYYNELAPADPLSSTGNGHVWLGCVATAMVQVMKYWGYPQTGMGSNSYSLSKYGTLSADFANSTYDWSLMPDNVTSSNAEVQRVCYHSAVSVNMSFGPYSSGAYLDNASSAYVNNFRYNNTIFEASKDQWDDAEWKSQIRRDIDAGRPVLYSGYNSSYSSGHAWVCDGYSDDYFHFNWGWGGTYNGNFLLSSLTPGSSNYSYDQAALFGIEPVIPASIHIPFVEGFESSVPDEIRLMGVAETSTEQKHIGSTSLRLGRESIVSRSTNAASICFVVPSDAELNFWVKRFTPNISGSNQQKAYIMPQYGSTPLIEIYNDDYNDANWVSYNVNLSAYAGQTVRLLFLQEKNDLSKQQWMYIDDISISGTIYNLAPYIPSNPDPSHQTIDLSLKPTLYWSGGDPNGDDLIYDVYLGTTNDPPLVSSVFNNLYTPPSLEHSTTFYWKIVADDGDLTTEGPLWSFTTVGVPPTVGTCGVSNLASKSVSVCGEIINHNKSVVGSRGICWSKAPDPSISGNFMESTEQTDLFLCEITGLEPFTNYYYRAFANSNQGIAYSDVQKFKTLPDLAVVSIDKVENVLRSKASVKGIINVVNDSSVTRRGVVWSTYSGFEPTSGTTVSEDGNWLSAGDFSVNLTNLNGPGTVFFRVFAVNSVGISYSDESMFTTLNQAPFVDLDLNNSNGIDGINYWGTTIEQMPGGNICDVDVEISDVDGDTIKQVVVQLINPFKTDSEFLTVLSENKNLIVEGDKTRQLSITSSTYLSYNDWKEVLRTIEYRNNHDSPHPEIMRRIQVKVADDLDFSNIATAYITITPVNDPPVNQIPPTLNTFPVFNSTVSILKGTWSDILDDCTGNLHYSYTWQLKNKEEEITDLNHDNQLDLPVGDNLCGHWIRIVEMVTDTNCGGSNIAVAQVEGDWYLVGQKAQSITFDPVPVHFYDEAYFTLSGSATSGLPLTFSVPKNKLISISGDTVFINNAGSVIVSGVQPGNECYSPSPLLYKIATIEKSGQNIVYEKAVEVKYSVRMMKIPAEATSGLALNVISSDSSVAFVVNDTIHFVGIGKATFSISQPGNQNYYPSDTVEMKLTIVKGDQLITTQYPDVLEYGHGRYHFTAVSSAQLDVQLISSDTSIIDIVGDSLIINGVGEVLITARQPGNDFCDPAADVVDTFVVKKGLQEIFVEEIEEKVIFAPSFTPVFYSSTGLDVIFSIRDTSIAKVVDGEIVIKNVGETFIDFNQSGNEFWEPAFYETPLKIVKANQIITFNTIETQLFGVEQVDLTAYSNSGLDVFFDISDQEIGTISGDILYIHNAGNAEITASQPGNYQYNPAVPVSVSFLVKKAPQTIISRLPDSLVYDRQMIYADVESTSGLIVDIVSSDTEIVKIVSDSLQITGTGVAELILNQPGNRNFLSADSVVRIVITERVGVPYNENTLFAIYPNPTQGQINLTVNGNATYPLQVSIVNSTGKTISNFETGNPINHIDLSNQPPGLYVVIVRSENVNVAQKLMISR